MCHHRDTATLVYAAESDANILLFRVWFRGDKLQFIQSINDDNGQNRTVDFLF